MRFWRRVTWTLVGLATLELASRTVLPGINPAKLPQLSGGGLIGLYAWLGGGGLARGAILSLGLMPYLAARLWVWISRRGNPAAKTLEGKRRMLRDTRILTVLLSLIQSFGFVNFVEGIPGAFTETGTWFVLRSIAILTLSSVAAMMVFELITPMNVEEDEEQLLLSSPATELRASKAALADVPGDR